MFLSLVLFVLGGFCFVLTDTAINYVEASFDTILLDVDASRRSELTLESVIVDLRLYLYCSGGAAWFIMILLLIVMCNVVRLVTPARAFSVLLQATNLAIVPLGIALIAAGLYVADTAATVEAPFAAFAVFLMGFLVVFFAVIGCIGVTIDSRGIIRLYQVLIGILCVLFLGSGVASLGLADQVRDQLLSRWDDIRRVLPPTFSGKYDQGQFQAFVETNLKAIGFMALCAGIILAIQLWAAMRLRTEIKRLNDLEDQVDDHFSKLATLVQELRQAEKDHRTARKRLQSTGRSLATVRVLAATMADECQREFAAEADRLEELAEVQEWGDEEIDALLSSYPSKWKSEQKEVLALRVAEWHRIRLQASKVAIEEAIHSIDAARIEGEGASGIAEAQKRMEVSGAGASAVGTDLEERFAVPKRRERKLNAGALFWKRWWTKGTRGSRNAVMCCCCALVFVIVIVLGMSGAALYFATSCSNLAGFTQDKSYVDLPSSQVWVESAVRRGVLSVEPGTPASTRLTVTKTAIDANMISSDFPTPGAHTPAEGEQAKPGVGVAVSEPPPTRVLSFDVSCQSVDALFTIPQRSQGTSTSSSGAAAADGTARALSSGPVARTRAAGVRSFLTRRLGAATRTGARVTQAAASATSSSPVEQSNNANRAAGGEALSRTSPGPWVSTDLVAAVVDAIEDAAARASASGESATVAPATAPLVNARATGNLATARLDWTATAHSARPFLHAVDIVTIAGADLTGVMMGGRGAAIATELGDISLTGVAAVCDASLLGTGQGGLTLGTQLGTVSLIDSVVYDCDVLMTGEASLVRIVNSVLLNENGGGSVTLSGTKGSLLAEHVSVERLTMQGREGSARVLATEVRESLKISTTQGGVLITELVAGPRAVVQVETSEGSIVLRAKQFRGIVSIVTGGAVKCSGGGFERRFSSDGSREVDPCVGAKAGDGGSLTFVEEARVNCVTASNRNDCAYLGEVTIVSNSGSVVLEFDKYTPAASA